MTKMNNTASKSQIRAAKVVAIAIGKTYADTAIALESKGFKKDGIPAGQTWRSAAKLTDAELLEGLCGFPNQKELR